MPIVSQNNSVVVDVGANEGLWIRSTGNAEVIVNQVYAGTPVSFNVTTDVLRVGFYGVPVTVSIRAVSGQVEYQNQQFSIQPITPDSSPLDVSLAVNAINDASKPAVVASQSQFKLSQGQSVQITNPVTKYGKVVANFMSGQWAATVGSPTLTQGFTGYNANGNVTGVKSRTGQQGMLLVEPTVDTTTRIQLNSPSTNLLTPQTNGKLGLWVYIEPMAANGDVGFRIEIELSTQIGATGTANGLMIQFVPNCLREGWNFLTFVMRDFRAYQTGQNIIEDHPLGVIPNIYGTGVDANILANNITLLRVNIAGPGATGSKIYFDSLWTDFSSKAQIVMGGDGGVGDVEIALPIFQQYGWIGYTAFPYRIWESGSTVIANLDSNVSSDGKIFYDAGWDFTNHTANHLRNGDLTSAAAIDYEMTVAQAWQNALGFIRGAEFYVSPQSSTSRLAERVISDLGYKLQRHAKHRNNHVTPFGLDNTNHIGSYDLGSVGASVIVVQQITNASPSAVTGGFQRFSRIKRAVDVAIAYGYADFPFWHGITTVGDDGTGEGLTGDNLLIYASAFTKMCEYIREKELAGEIEVCRGMSGFYYGVSND